MLTPTEYEAEYLRCLRAGYIEQLDTLIDACDTDALHEAMMRATRQYMDEENIPRATAEDVEAVRQGIVQKLAASEMYEEAAACLRTWPPPSET